MDNVTFFISELDGAEIALIDRGNGEFTSMLKSEYDKQQAEQSTPSLENGTISQEYGKTLQGRSAAQGADR